MAIFAESHTLLQAFMNKGASSFLQLRKFVAPEYVFGLDARKMATQYSLKLGVRRLFIVTDKQVKATRYYLEMIADLEGKGIDYVVFDGISPNPRNEEVMAGADFYRTERCNMILAYGGGSVIDAAKGIGIVATNNAHINTFEGVDQIRKPMPPLISVPTTGGTAADVSQFAIINNVEERYKMAIISKALISDIALVDPLLLTTMDDYLTACTGVDALSHAVEAYVSNAGSPITRLYALEAIKMIYTNLQPSIQNPMDVELRGKIALASLYAGLAFSNASLGCVHSMAHSLGGYLDLPHGECNGKLLPHVVNYNFDAAIDEYKQIAQVFNIDSISNNTNMVKKLLVGKLIDFNNDLGIEVGLKQKGVTQDLTHVLATKAILDPCNATNPRVPSQGDLEHIYKEAL